MPSVFERLAYRVSGGSRERKWNQFLTLIGPRSEETIVDIGVNTTEYSEGDNFLEKHYPYPERITAVGLGDDFTAFSAKYPSVKTLSADGCALPFSDGQFDVSYSNAVIEHVGSHEDQRRFLSEMRRVAKRGYLTTPNRHFPIEVHTRVPLLHLLLPRPLFDAVLRAIGKGWAADDYMHLLSEKELRSLLAEAGIEEYTLVKNRFFGFPMTFTVVWPH